MEEIGTIWLKDDQEIVFQVGPYEGKIWGDVRIFRIKNHKPQLWGVRVTKDDVINILEIIKNPRLNPNFINEEELFRKEINSTYFLILRSLQNNDGVDCLDLRYFDTDTGFHKIKGVEIPYQYRSEIIKYFNLMLKKWEEIRKDI